MVYWWLSVLSTILHISVDEHVRIIILLLVVLNLINVLAHFFYIQAIRKQHKRLHTNHVYINITN